MLFKLFVFVSDFFSSALSFVKVLFFSRFRLQKPEMKEEKVIVLGMGPSFSQTYSMYKDLLMSHTCFAVNNFANNPEFESIKPKHYIIGGPELWQEGLGEFYDNFSLKLLNNLKEKTSWNLNVFLEHKAKNAPRLKILKENQHIKLYFYNPTPIEGFKWFKNMLFDQGLGLPRPHNVFIPSIMISRRMKYKKVFLVGGDHSWHEELRVNEGNQVLLNQKHYSDVEEDWKTMKLKAGRPRLLHEVFHKWMLAFKGYVEIEEYSEGRDFKVYNASEKSYIDGFERIKLKEIENV